MSAGIVFAPFLPIGYRLLVVATMLYAVCCIRLSGSHELCMAISGMRVLAHIADTLGVRMPVVPAHLNRTNTTALFPAPYPVLP